jgi:hypothetical protein
MNKKSSFIKTLKILCAVGEAFTFVGILAVVVSIPFSESLIDSRRANVGLFVVNGSPSWSFIARLPHSNNGSISFGGPIEGQLPAGEIRIGPFGMKVDEGAFSAASRDFKAQAVVIDHIEGTVTFKHPENAAQVLASIKWPFVVATLCTGVPGLVILELLRRMFQSAERGEIFSSANIRNVRAIGFLLIASSILKLMAVEWLANRMATYVKQHVEANVTFASTHPGYLSGLGTGFVILALAEVFRQGLKLKEDTQFTI